MVAQQSLALRPLWEAQLEGFGVEVDDVDFAGNVDDVAWQEILSTLHTHQVLCFRNQHLTPEQFDSYARHFGEPIPHVLDHFRMEGLPSVMTLTNDLKLGETKGAARAEAIVKGAAFWHTDQSYEPEPSSATTLYAIQVPKEGGGTRFANMFAAYDDLPGVLKRQLEGLLATHLYGNRDAGRDGEFEASPLRGEDQVAKVPECHHPIVRPHPVTGRKALYAVSGTSRGIVGWPEDEALALLGELKAHALQPQYVSTHYYTVGDIVLWDTASTLHSAEPIEVATTPETTRMMWRSSVKGLPPLLQKAS